MPQEYEEKYISNNDRERAKYIFDVIISKIKLHCSQFGFMDSGVFIPEIIRSDALVNALKVKEGNVWSMTVNDRLVRYFTIIALSRMDNRLRIIDKETGESRIIPTFADLKTALNLMHRASSQIRLYVAEFYNDVFLPTYNSYEVANTGVKGGETVTESQRGITDAQIDKYIKNNGMETFDRRTIRERFLDPLSNQGILNKTRSEIDRRSFIYSPVKDYETGISSIFDDDKDPRLTIEDPECYPTIEKIADQFSVVSSQSLRERGDITANRYEIKNSDQQKIDFAEMISYLGNPDKCFKMGFSKEEEKRHTKLENTALGRLFGHLKHRNLVNLLKKPSKKVENPDIVDDVTIEQKSHKKGDTTKTDFTSLPEGLPISKSLSFQGLPEGYFEPQNTLQKIVVSLPNVKVFRRGTRRSRPAKQDY